MKRLLFVALLITLGLSSAAIADNPNPTPKHVNMPANLAALICVETKDLIGARAPNFYDPVEQWFCVYGDGHEDLSDAGKIAQIGLKGGIVGASVKSLQDSLIITFISSDELFQMTGDGFAGSGYFGGEDAYSLIATAFSLDLPEKGRQDLWFMSEYGMVGYYIEIKPDYWLKIYWSTQNLVASIN